VVGSEKGLGFGQSRSLAGKPARGLALQRQVYKHLPERNGVQVVLDAVKRTEKRSTLSGAARPRVGTAGTPD
jgi:hypothetical protein